SAAVSKHAEHAGLAELAAGVRRERIDRIAAARASAPAPATPELPVGQLDPAEVCRMLREIAGPSGLVTVDPGTPTPNVSAEWTLETAGRNIVVPRGHGPMGYALPAAVGVAFARP